MSTAYQFTVADFDRMIAAGLFNENERVELIRGEIRKMTPPNPPHDYMIDLLNYWSVRNTTEDEVWVRIQNSLGIPALDSVTLPDVAWMRARDYRRRRPQPRDVLLLIEVSESSLPYDRGEKADLYAEAGIKDYWIVNLNDSCIEVHRKPRKGKYSEIETYQIGQTVNPLAAASLSLSVSDLFSK